VQEAKREAVIRRILAGNVDVTEAALLLGLSERQVWRLRACFLADGRGRAHGNRGRSPANRNVAIRRRWWARTAAHDSSPPC